MAGLTTHVLDTAYGVPAAGVALTLYRVAGETRERICTAVTNADGRVDEPLLTADTSEAGTYELSFAAGAYFKARGTPLPTPPFVDDVVLRFGIADPGAHYHVPLLVSPWSYSTYRGS
ncbi:MAG: hydroxyisourate hydrolase [Pseudomonadota bacterium]